MRNEEICNVAWLEEDRRIHAREDAWYRQQQEKKEQERDKKDED